MAKALSSVRAGSSRLSTVLSTVGMRRADAETMERSVGNMLTDNVLLQRLEAHADTVQETLRTAVGLGGGSSSSAEAKRASGGACATPPGTEEPLPAQRSSSSFLVVDAEAHDDDDSASGSWISVSVRTGCGRASPSPRIPAAAAGLAGAHDADATPPASPTRPSSPHRYTTSFSALWADSRSNISSVSPAGSTDRLACMEHDTHLHSPRAAARAPSHAAPQPLDPDDVGASPSTACDSPTVHIEVFKGILSREVLDGTGVSVEALLQHTAPAAVSPYAAAAAAASDVSQSQAMAPRSPSDADPTGTSLVDSVLASISDAYTRICEFFSRLFFGEAYSGGGAKATHAMRYVFLSALLTVGIIAARRVPYHTAVPFLSYLVHFVARQFES